MLAQSFSLFNITFRRNRTLFYASVMFVILIAVFAAIAGLYYQYQVADSKALNTTQNLARALEISIEGMIDKIDISLQASADEISRQIASGKPNSNAITDYLKRQHQRLPGVAYVRATNERGDLIYGPGVVFPPVNQSDRDFFIMPRDHAEMRLFVDKPVFARINKTWVWPFSRRISKADGSFGGVVFASIVLEQFEKQLANLELGKDGRIAVRDVDQGLIASFPPASSKIPVGDRYMSSAFHEASKVNPLSGSYVTGADSVDGISRTVSYRKNEKYGFMVNVGISRKVMFDEWRRQAWLIGGLIAALVSLLLALTRYVSRTWQRQEKDMFALQGSQQALSEAKDAAESASRAKSEFLASMSHELRTPLNATIGYAQLMSSDDTLSENNRENAVEIERAGKHLLHLVNDMIDLARIESGKLELSIESVQVKAVLSNCLAMVNTMAETRGIQLIEKFEIDEMVTVKADFTRLRQVVINFLSNAIKYNRPGGSVTLHTHMKGGAVYISVLDTGGGIPAEKQSRIFNAFDRLGKESGTEEGTGIGLLIAKRMVEAMGGNIGFESVMGEGSTFWVAFPLGVPLDVSEAEMALPSVEEAPDSQGSMIPIVLYVEDNPMNLRLMRKIFMNRSDLELRDASSAEDGIKLAREIQPALILMDINLPGMDGYRALKSLKSDSVTAHIPVIAVTANAMKGDVERGLKAGFADYVVKPLDISKLFEAINKALATNQSIQK